MSEDTRTAIRAFIVENFLFGDEIQPLPGEMSLIDNDLVDSTGILELVGFLEERYGISMTDAEIVPANLDTIDAIAGFIARKQAA